MSQPAIDWDADLQPDPQEEYDALRRALRRSEGFGLLFVQCTPAAGMQIIERVKTDLPSKRVGVLSFDQPIAEGNLFLQVQTHLSQTPADVLFIQGLEHSLLDYEDTKRSLGWTEQEIHSYSWKGVPPVMVNLNQQRENFRDQLHATLVFLVPPYVVKYLIHRAPDFFDWRSGIFEFPLDKVQLQSATLAAYIEQRDEAGFKALSPKERQVKLLDIQALLDEPELGSDEKANLLLEQALLLTHNNETKAAVACYGQILKIYPNDYIALYNRGNLLSKLGLKREAYNCYEKALEIEPESHEALYNKGNMLAELEQYEAAIACYDKALKVKPDKHEALHNKGCALHELNQFEAAINCFNQVLAIKSDYIRAIVGKGNALCVLGRYQEAVECYDEVLSKEPDQQDNEILNLYNMAIVGKGYVLRAKEGSQPFTIEQIDFGDLLPILESFSKNNHQP